MTDTPQTERHARPQAAAVTLVKVKAICFDLDGTLYNHQPLRRAMMLRLLGGHLRKPFQAVRTTRILWAYRRAQEVLRGRPASGGSIADEQMRLCSELSGCPVDAVATCVATWFEQAPLPLIGKFVRPGAADFLRRAQERGLRLAVLSDYPAREKLRAMGLLSCFDLVLSAQDPAVQAFKPDPAGLRRALGQLDLEPAEMLYVGDRADVDAEAARRAGVPAAIFEKRSAGRALHWLSIQNFGELRDACAL